MQFDDFLALLFRIVFYHFIQQVDHETVIKYIELVQLYQSNQTLNVFFVQSHEQKLQKELYKYNRKMLGYIFFLIIQWTFFTLIKTSFSGISELTSTSSFSNMNFKSSLITQDGTVGYVAFMQNGINLINAYNLTTSPLGFIGSFDNLGNSITPDRMCLVGNNLITFTPYSNTIHYFDITLRKYAGNFTVGQGVDRMTYLKIKNLIVYSSTSSGMVKYFNANLSLPLSITTIASGLSATIYSSVSQQQTYIAIGDNSNKFKVYDLSNLSLVYSLTATSGWAFKAFTWHPNGTVLFFANDQQDYFYYVNLSNSFQLKKSAAIYRPSNQWAPYQMHYMQGSDELVVVGYYNGGLNNVTVFTWNYLTETVGFSYSVYYSEMLTGMTFDTNNQAYFATFSPNKAQFFTLQGVSDVPVASPDNSTLNTTNSNATDTTNVTATNTTNDIVTPTTNDTLMTNTTDLNNTAANTTEMNNTATNTTDITNTTTITNSTNITDPTNTTTPSNQTNIPTPILTDNTTSTTTPSDNTTIPTNTTTAPVAPTNDTTLTTPSNNTVIHPTVVNNDTNITIPTPTVQNLSYLSDQAFETYQQIMSNMLQNQGILTLNSIPGGRKILKPIFAFFVNFDDIWLYIYHPRQYNRVINTVFALTQTLQAQKWKLVPFSALWSKVGLDTQWIKDKFNYRLNYTSSKFVEVESNSNGFLINSLNLFFSNALFTLLVYLFFRLMFRIFFHFRISIFFRPFAFWPIYVIMFLQGNIQYLTFLFSYEIRNLFAFDFIQKASLGFSLVLYFLVFFFGAGSFFVFKEFYGPLTKYFLDNIHLDLKGIGYFSIYMGYKNILLGMFHGFFDGSYILKLSLLLTTQFILFTYSASLLSKKMCFYYKTKVWINQNATLARMGLILTFLIDQLSLSLTTSIFQCPHLVLIYFYMLLFLIGIFIEAVTIFYQIKAMLCLQQAIKKKTGRMINNMFFVGNQQHNFTIQLFDRSENIKSLVDKKAVRFTQTKKVDDQFQKIQIRMNSKAKTKPRIRVDSALGQKISLFNRKKLKINFKSKLRNQNQFKQQYLQAQSKTPQNIEESNIFEE